MKSLKFGIDGKFLENNFAGVLFQGKKYAMLRNDSGEYFFKGKFIEEGEGVALSKNSMLYEMLIKQECKVLNSCTNIMDKEFIEYAKMDIASFNYYIDAKQLKKAMYVKLNEHFHVKADSDNSYSLIIEGKTQVTHKKDVTAFELLSYLEIYRGAQGILEFEN